MEAVETDQDYRVRVTSKKEVTEQINKYKEILKTALDGQTHAAEDTKRVLVQELQAVSETTCLRVYVTNFTFRYSRGQKSVHVKHQHTAERWFIKTKGATSAQSSLHDNSTPNLIRKITDLLFICCQHSCARAKTLLKAILTFYEISL